MIRLKTLFTVSILLTLSLYAQSQFRSLSGIHDLPDTSIVNLMQKFGIGKVTYYFDNLNKVDGTWEFYPMIQVSKNISAVSVSTIPGINSKYTFLVLIDNLEKEIIDTLGPYYDSMIEAIDVKLKNKQLYQLRVRLINPPEPFEKKYTIVKYIRTNNNFKEIKD